MQLGWNVVEWRVWVLSVTEPAQHKGMTGHGVRSIVLNEYLNIYTTKIIVFLGRTLKYNLKYNTWTPYNTVQQVSVHHSHSSQQCKKRKSNNDNQQVFR